jgi:hypothetical protein
MNNISNSSTSDNLEEGNDEEEKPGEVKAYQFN